MSDGIVKQFHTRHPSPQGPRGSGRDARTHTKHAHATTNFHDARRSAYVGVGALDATSLGSLQQADPGGLHQPRWSFSVLSHCPPHLRLLLRLHPSHRRCSSRRCSGCRYAQHSRSSVHLCYFLSSLGSDTALESLLLRFAAAPAGSTLFRRATVGEDGGSAGIIPAAPHPLTPLESPCRWWTAAAGADCQRESGGADAPHPPSLSLSSSLSLLAPPPQPPRAAPQSMRQRFTCTSRGVAAARDRLSSTC